MILDNQDQVFTHQQDRSQQIFPLNGSAHDNHAIAIYPYERLVGNPLFPDSRNGM